MKQNLYCFDFLKACSKLNEATRADLRILDNLVNDAESVTMIKVLCNDPLIFHACSLQEILFSKLNIVSVLMVESSVFHPSST
jgi:MarR-like DNA-binding transcriptional regulator SgrR of sgrS sRNA